MYQCKNCGGNLKFDIATQSMHCDYCDSSYSPYEITKETDALEGNYYETNIFYCPQCGAELISSDTDATSFCSYCGAANILTSRISHEKRPERIIPFQITKEQCKEIYAKKLKHSLFAPRELTNPDFIDSFRGIYMPYRSYTFTQSGNYTLYAHKEYSKGNYIYTDYYRLEGEMDASYQGISFDASSSFFDNVSQNIGTFSSDMEKDFTPSYLSGFYADTADIPKELYEDEAKLFAETTSQNRLLTQSCFHSFEMSDHKGNRRIPEAHCSNVSNMLYPVWFLSYRKDDRIAYAAINGQTGKLFMDTPIDLKKYAVATALSAIVLFVLLNLFVTFKPATLLFLSALLAAASAFLYVNEIQDIYRRNNNTDDKGLQSKNTAIPKSHEKLSWKQSIGFLSSIASVALCIIIALIHPVEDLFYYIGSIAAMLGILTTLISIIKNYNTLATRKLPQFHKQGGDDLA